jgi:hypothetical protein
MDWKRDGLTRSLQVLFWCFAVLGAVLLFGRLLVVVPPETEYEVVSLIENATYMSSLVAMSVAVGRLSTSTLSLAVVAIAMAFVYSIKMNRTFLYTDREFLMVIFYPVSLVVPPLLLGFSVLLRLAKLKGSV